MIRYLFIAFICLSTVVFAQSPLKELTTHTDDITIIQLSPDGKSYFTASRDNKIVQLNAENLDVIREFTGHTSVITALFIHPEGKYMMSGSDDGSAIFWEIETGKMLHRVRNHQGSVNGVAISFDKEANMFFTAGEDGKICGYDRKLFGKWVRTTTQENKTPIKTLVMDVYGKILFTGGADGKIRKYSVDKDELLGVFDGGHTRDISAMALSTNGLTMATGSNDRTIKTWNLETMKEEIILTGHTWNIYSVAFNTSGEYLATSSNDGTVRIWNIAQGKEVKKISFAKRRTFSAVAFSDNATQVLTGCQVEKNNPNFLFLFESGLPPTQRVFPKPIVVETPKPEPTSKTKKK